MLCNVSNVVRIENFHQRIYLSIKVEYLAFIKRIMNINPKYDLATPNQILPSPLMNWWQTFLLLIHTYGSERDWEALGVPHGSSVSASGGKSKLPSKRPLRECPCLGLK